MDEPLHPAQIAAYRRMTPRQKIEQAQAMYWAARRLKANFLRQQHPDWTEVRPTPDPSRSRKTRPAWRRESRARHAGDPAVVRLRHVT